MSIQRRLKITMIMAALSLSWLVTQAVSTATPATAATAGSGASVSLAEVPCQPTGACRIRHPATGLCVAGAPRTAPLWGIAYLEPCSSHQRQAWNLWGTKYQNPWFELRGGDTTGCLDAQSRGGLTLHISSFDCNRSPNQAWAFNQRAFNDPNNPPVNVCTRAAAACDLVWGLWNIDGRLQVGLQPALTSAAGRAGQTFSPEDFFFGASQ